MSTSGAFSTSSSKHHAHVPFGGNQLGVTDAGIHLFTGDTLCASPASCGMPGLRR